MADTDIKIEGLNAPLERTAQIDAPCEEMKAFAAGLRVGYKKGFEAGYAQRATEEVDALQPSEVLFNKPKIQ